VGTVATPDARDPVARAVAQIALQAARDAGATYADVRVDADTHQTLGVWRREAMGPIEYSDTFTYGVRVIANGQWGFAGGQDPDPDAVARIARRAVAQATVDAAGRPSPVVLAPAPVVSDGVWDTPIELDPFTVPIAEQQALLLEGIAAALGVRGVRSASGTLSFERTVRTFASSDGSFIVQTLHRSFPGGWANAALATDPEEWVGWRVAGLEPAAAGFETVRNARLTEGFAVAGAAAVAAANPHAIDVGRYDIVVSARVMASLIEGTLARAASLDRATGRDATFAGTSFAQPPHAVLGAGRLASPLVTITGDRSAARGLATVGWDSEGIRPETFPIITSGVLVDYVTTRESAPALAWWYDKQGRPVRSHGCAGGGGLETPTESPPNLVMQGGSGAVSVDDLIRDVKRGLYFSEDGAGGTDSQLLNGRWTASAVQEIRNGKLVGYVRDAAMVFRTPDLWKSLDAVGGIAAA
jgi:TldD protein